MANINTTPSSSQTTNETSHTAHQDDPDYDGVKNSLAQRLLPNSLDPYIRLLRIDRPIGTWLLALPSLWGLAAAYRSDVSLLTNISAPNPLTAHSPWFLFALFLAGAFFTRSAGCVFNDIADRKIDRQVARTKSRPLASGAISVKTALLILIILLSAAFALLLQLNNLTIGLGTFILAPILIYPFMKRITYWPQAMLSLCFSWGALMGWTAVKNQLDWTAILITIASFAWTMGFDTIYAHQDKDDDAMIGMKSTALRFGEKTNYWLTGFYGLTIIIFYAVGLLIGAGLIYFTAIGMAALHASWQISTLKLDDPANCLHRFRSNKLFGLIILIGLSADLAFASLLTI